MKKLLATSVMSLLAVSVFGQGQVVLQNLDTSTTPQVRAPIYLDVVGGVALSGTDTSFRAALLGGPTTGIAANIPGSRTNSAGGGAPVLGNLGLLASPNTGNTWTTFRTGAAAGFVGVGSDGARVIPNVPYSGQALVQVVAWTGNFTTWDAAYSAWLSGAPGVRIGASNPLTLTTTTGPTDQIFPRLVGLESFAVVPVIPEPSTFALAGLGAAALLILRRRK